MLATPAPDPAAAHHRVRGHHLLDAWEGIKGLAGWIWDKVSGWASLTVLPGNANDAAKILPIIMQLLLE